MVFLSSSKAWVPTVLLSALSFHPGLGSTGRAPNLCSITCAQSCLKAQSRQLPTTAASNYSCCNSFSPACRSVNSLEFGEQEVLTYMLPGKHKRRPSLRSRLLTSHPGSIQCFPDARRCRSLPSCSCPTDRAVTPGAGRSLLLMGWGIWVQDRNREGGKWARKEREEMKGWLPPTSTSSGNILHPLSSSQHNPRLCFLPLFCHTPHPHFKMWFGLNDSVSGCASRSWTSSPEHTPSI